MTDAESNAPKREYRGIGSRGYGGFVRPARSARVAGAEKDAPAPVREDIGAVVSALPPGDREYIRNLPEADLIALHRTLGLNLRNAFRAGRYRHLFGYCLDRETSETRSYDSISETAIYLVWAHLRAAPEAEPGAAADGGA